MTGSLSLLRIAPVKVEHEETIWLSQGADTRLAYAASGNEGLANMARYTFSVVIASENLPDMTGLEFLQKARKAFPANTIILITSPVPTLTGALQAFRNGADDYLAEPVAQTAFNESISIALNKRQKMSHPAEWLGLWAHEAASPLAAIQASAQVLSGSYLGSMNPKQEHELASILRNCGYLEDTIGCYLHWAELELLHQPMEMEMVDWIKNVIQPVIQKPEYRNNPKSMAIILSAESVPPITGNTSLLRIVVNNLINNAIKYGREHSTIRLRLFRENRSVILAIQNEGSIISPHDIEHRLFQPFVRLKPKGSEGVKGSGLGLYLSQRIVLQHGGKLSAHSGPGERVEFRASLPEASSLALSND